MFSGPGRRVVLPLMLLAWSGCQADTVVRPTLAATCSAEPSSGAVPLSVNFNLNVAGAEGSFAVAIAYGDGSSGSDPGASHIYSAAGAYTVTFTVRTASQSALCSANVNVSAPPAPTPPPNQPPVAVFKTTPVAGAGNVITGAVLLGVRFNLCASHDPEQDVLYFTMDFQGDGTYDIGGTTGAQCRHDYTYAVGTYRPKVCVTDLGPDRAPAHPYQCERYTVQVNP